MAAAINKQSKAVKPLKVKVEYGCILADPITGEVYGPNPKPVLKPSVWVDVQVQLGNLKKVTDE